MRAANASSDVGVGLGVAAGRRPPGQGVEPAERPARRPRCVSRLDLDRRAVVGLQQHHAVGPRVDRARSGRAGCRSCRATSTSSRPRRRRRRRGASSGWRSACPSATAWARSFSWWGNFRSRPPQWRSKPSPEQVERHHHALGVPARAARRPTATARPARPAWPASTGRSRPGGACARRRTTSRSPPPAQHARRATGGRAARSPRTAATVEVDAVVGHVGAADRRRARRSARPSASTYSVAWGMSVGRADVDAVHRLATRPLRTLRRSRAASRPSRLARSMILSSMSVMFDTRRTCEPAPLAGSGGGCRRRGWPGRGRGAAGRRRWGRTGRCSPCRARAGRARGSPGGGVVQAHRRPSVVSRGCGTRRSTSM